MRLGTYLECIVEVIMSASSLITGITGQDGALLAKNLVERGDNVTGLFRRSSSDNFWRLKDLGIIDRVEMIEADIESYVGLGDVLSNRKFDTVFHLAGSSFTAESFRKPWQTFSINTSATFHLLEAVKNYSPESLVVLAGTSEVFGNKDNLNTELARGATSYFGPSNPYGLSHLSNMQVAEYYRNTYNLRIVIPIMFNHESEYRGVQFLTKKLCSGVARIHKGNGEPLLLGNMGAKKDWGSAKEFMGFLSSLTQLNFSGNFTLGTGRTTSIRDIVTQLFSILDVEVQFVGTGLDEKVIKKSNGVTLIGVDARYMREKETQPFTADSKDCFEIFGAAPNKTVIDILPDMLNFELRKWSRE